jgi:hypothetical protein
VTQRRTGSEGAILSGRVLDIDYDADTITVELDDGRQQTFPFELFDSGDVYQAGQPFELKVDDAGGPAEVATSQAPQALQATVNGYVESVDQDDELAWVYVRGEEGWQRKVMPLSLFEEMGLARPGAHFLLDLDENGTPLALHPDEDELEMLPQAIEETKPRWIGRPAAEAEPDS